jgi:superfamily II DNA or RNA helicase
VRSWGSILDARAGKWQAESPQPMELVERKSYVYVVNASTITVQALRTHFSAPHPRAYMMKKRNAGKKYWDEWDGRVHFFNLWKGDPTESTYRLPVGFLPKLLKFLRDEELDFVFEQQIEIAEFEFASHLVGPDGKELVFDETQVAASKALLSKRRVAIELGTGSGKTEIVLNAFQCVRQIYPDVKMLFVVPKLNLLAQTVKRIEERFPGLPKIGWVGEGEFDIDSPLVVGTMQTVSAGEHIVMSKQIKEWLKTIDILAIDEAHHSQSFQGQSLIDICPSKWLWAVSAKVTYVDKKNIVKHMTLEGLFGPPAFQGKSATRTCPTTIIMHRHRSWEGSLGDIRLYNTYVNGLPVKYKLGPKDEWRDAIWRGPDSEGIVDPTLDPDLMKEVKRAGRTFLVPDNTKYGFYQKVKTLDPYGEEIEVWEAIDCESQYTVCWTTHDIGIVVFRPRNEWAIKVAVEARNKKEPFVISYKRSRHPLMLKPLIKEAGLNVRLVNGKLSGPQQLELFEQVKNREIDGIVAAYSIVAEGVDIPNLVHLIKLDGITEEQVLTQQRGRVERVFPGKERGYIHIPYDYQHERLLRNSQAMSGYYKRQNKTGLYLEQKSKVVIREWD